MSCCALTGPMTRSATPSTFYRARSRRAVGSVVVPPPWRIPGTGGRREARTFQCPSCGGSRSSYHDHWRTTSRGSGTSAPGSRLVCPPPRAPGHSGGEPIRWARLPAVGILVTQELLAVARYVGFDVHKTTITVAVADDGATPVDLILGLGIARPGERPCSGPGPGPAPIRAVGNGGFHDLISKPIGQDIDNSSQPIQTCNHAGSGSYALARTVGRINQLLVLASALGHALGWPSVG